MNNKKFAAAVNCIDGRIQMPVINWLKKQYGVSYIDMITEAGPNKIISEDKYTIAIDSIKRRLEISVNNHGSELIAVTGHYDCAGNPANKEEQIKQIISSVKKMETWNLKSRIIGLWIDENHDVWQII